MILEIRTYRVRPGHLPGLVDLMRSTRPLLESYGIDVVTLGPSLVSEEGDHAVLVRAFADIAERDRLETAFYGGDEWRNGPRAAFLGLISAYHTVVLEVDPDAVEALRSAT